jgi:hypothetical protein
MKLAYSKKTRLEARFFFYLLSFFLALFIVFPSTIQRILFAKLDHFEDVKPSGFR